MIGEICGVCFETPDGCVCVSTDLGKPIPSKNVAPRMLEAASALEIELGEDPDTRPYLWDLPEHRTCR